MQLETSGAPFEHLKILLSGFKKVLLALEVLTTFCVVAQNISVSESALLCL